MKKFFKNIKNLLIVVLVIVILLLMKCSGKSKPPEETVITKTEIKWDTIQKVVPTYVPKWIDRVLPPEHIYDTIFKDVDTLEILKDYFASYIYFDTLKNDSVTVVINDTISQNKIKNRSIKYEILYPTITITKETYLNKRRFYGGIGVGGTTKELAYISGEALFTSKKKTAFGLGVGLNNKFEPIFMGKIYWKLGK